MLYIYNSQLALGGDIYLTDAAIAIIVGFSIVVPAAVVIVAVTAALGIAGYGVTQLLDARADYYDATEIYAVIKTYPHL